MGISGAQESKEFHCRDPFGTSETGSKPRRSKPCKHFGIYFSYGVAVIANLLCYCDVATTQRGPLFVRMQESGSPRSDLRRCHARPLDGAVALPGGSAGRARASLRASLVPQSPQTVIITCHCELRPISLRSPGNAMQPGGFE
jgi:hypothetical protein